MKALFVKTSTSGTEIINLDAVARISTEGVEGAGFQPSICFTLVGGDEFRFYLDKGTSEADVMDRVRLALVPLYEGRMNNVMGLKLDLDLTPLQRGVERF